MSTLEEATEVKGQYGAGTVEIWDDGVYECATALPLRIMDAEFRLICTKSASLR